MIHDKSNTEVLALVRLMEDPDPMIFEQVTARLRTMGGLALPIIEEAWSKHINDYSHHEKIGALIRDIRKDDIRLELEKWRESSNRDLLKGALILSKFQYPELDFVAIEKEMEVISRKVWLEINDENTAFEIVKVINHVLFEQCGFESSNSDFYAPQHSYINTLLESKKGNPLSLSMLYSIVAQKLNIPIYGVNLPNHFVLGFVDERQTLKFLGLEENEGNILFYINPFSKGRIFDHNEIENYLRSLNLPLQKHYFEPCSNSEILKRMITNLTYAYSKVGDRDRVSDLEELQSILG